LVKQLRDRTGASMGKCREALGAEEGDIERAVEWLKKRGVRSMEKRANDAAEALLAIDVAADGSAGALIELRAETDFVTRNDIFQQFCVYVANLAAKHRPSGGAPELLEKEIGDGAGRPKQIDPATGLGPALLELGSVLGERLVLGDAKCLVAPEAGVIGGYVHPKMADGLANTGRMAALVALRPLPASAPCDADRLRAIVAQLARHVVAAQPRFLSVASISADVVEKEREVFWAAHLEQLGPRKSGTIDENVKSKVLAGKMQKFYSENVLMCQELIAAPPAGSGESAKPAPVAEWLEQEARAMGLEQIAVEDFVFVTL